MDNQFLVEFSKFGIIIGALWALVQFWSSNEFKKSQYLSELWRKFYLTEEFVEIFDLIDRDDLENFNKIESKVLFKYLAFLEEIVIFRKVKFYEIYKLRDKSIIDLFQFHFYNLYLDEKLKTRDAFWRKICLLHEKTDFDLESEIKKHYWRHQYRFAIKCSKVINNYNQV